MRAHSAGELLFFGANTISAPHCVFGRSDAEGRLRSSVEVPLQQAVLMHDFAITESYAVFIDGSLVMDTAVRSGLQVLKEDQLMEACGFVVAGLGVIHSCSLGFGSCHKKLGIR